MKITNKLFRLLILTLCLGAGFCVLLWYQQNRHQQNQRQVNLIQVDKSDKSMMLITRGGDTIRTYHIELGFSPKGHKQRLKDGKTPEGTYKITIKNPESIAYKSLRISYPNERDKEIADSLGVNPGGDIMIHGLLNGTKAAKDNRHPKPDWTGGCIAVTNTEMDEIYELVKVGTKIIIKP